MLSTKKFTNTEHIQTGNTFQVLRGVQCLLTCTFRPIKESGRELNFLRYPNHSRVDMSRAVNRLFAPAIDVIVTGFLD